MAVKYFVYNANLLGKTKKIAKVTELRSYSMKEIIEKMVQGKTGLGKVDIEAFFNLFKEQVVSICKEGGSVNLEGFMSFQPSIGGTFDSENAGFDKSKNDVYMIAKISPALNERFQVEANVEKVSSSDRRPRISETNDLATKVSNTNITVGNIITVKGENLKFDSNSEEEYLDIVNAENEAEAIRITSFQKITDKEIVFLCPALKAKRAYIEIGSLMGSKTLRVGTSTIVEVKTA
jgi:hypothetical protein